MFVRIAIVALSAVLALPLRAEPFAIMDREGFSEPMTAITIDLPPGWTATGRIAWLKPCSGNELYEVILNARSADGQAGLRLMPGHSVQWLDVSADHTVDPMIAQMAVAQAESSRNQMRTAFRDSNCHVGKVADTRSILDALVLPKRPQGVRITGIAPDEGKLATYRASIGQPVHGMVTSFDAAVVDLAWAGPSGEMVERVWLAWYQFADDPRANYMAGIPGNHFQNTTIEGITLAWAPAARAAEIEAAEAALKAARVDPAWQARVQEAQRKLAEERARAREQAQRDRETEEMRRDREHQRFLETIRGD